MRVEPFARVETKPVNHIVLCVITSNYEMLVEGTKKQLLTNLVQLSLLELLPLEHVVERV